jgi:D-3-phosphoglycerate dehydrogenase
MDMKILVSDSLSGKGIEIFEKEEGFLVDVKTDLTEKELISIIDEYDALIIRSGTQVNSRVIEAAGNLKVIGRAGVGLDNVDVEAATRLGVIVMNTPGGNNITTAEHTVCLLLALSRKIPAANRSMKKSLWEKSRFLGVEVYRKTVGIIGLGRIGAEVGLRLKALGMRVVIYDPYISKEAVSKSEFELVELDNLLENADFITFHTPLTRQTYHMIDEKTIRKMKKGVFLINCARGGIVDEQALAQAISGGHVAGAAMDVFESEPPAVDNPLLGLDEVTCTPHIGASTTEAQENVSVAIACQVIDVLKHNIIVNAVNTPTIGPDAGEGIHYYCNLVEKMGKILGQIVPGRFQELLLKYSGGILEHNLSIITAAAIKGVLEPIMKENVNYVNAPFHALQRKIDVQETKHRETEAFTSKIIMELRSDKERRSISGTLFGKKEPRIVALDEFQIEAIPYGYMLLISNEDVPGVVGRLGNLMGKFDINIGSMQLGRKDVGGVAVSLLNIDQRASSEVLGSLRKMPNILSVRQFKV